MFFTLRFTGESLMILDQTRLPGAEVHLALTTAEDVREAIGALRVRGAPAIGVAAAYGFLLGVRSLLLEDDFSPDRARELAGRLASVRPTAVNLRWALDRMMGVIAAVPGEELERRLLAEAQAIESEDHAACLAIGEHGLSLLRPGMGVMTYCNAGALAATAYGTALAPLYLAHERDFDLKIYTCETRPLLQGARLTAYELMRSGMDVTVICDNMAAAMMKEGRIDAVLTGADRIAANGDTANKIGTLGLAILAKHFNIPFYVCAPLSTLDPDCADGGKIVIEERDPAEVTSYWYSSPMAPAGVRVRNPAFDVTDTALITAIITETGVQRPPYDWSKGSC